MMARRSENSLLMERIVASGTTTMMILFAEVSGYSFEKLGRLTICHQAKHRDGKDGLYAANRQYPIDSHCTQTSEDFSSPTPSVLLVFCIASEACRKNTVVM